MKKILIVALLLPLLNSCGDFLTPKQENLIYNEVFWKTQLDAEKAVYGVYALYRAMKTPYENTIGHGDLPLGYLRGGWYSNGDNKWWNTGNYHAVQTDDSQSWGSSQFGDIADWGKHYKVVAQANIVIKNIASMPENVFKGGMKKQLLGEAYFLRALVYFDIARIWGNAPLVTEAIESSDQLIDDDMTPLSCPRSDDYKIVEQVLSDAKTAQGMLTYDSFGTETWGIRANKASAEALLGDANLWMNFLAKRDGLPNPDQYITDAVKALEDCVRYGGASYEGYSTTDSLPMFFQDASKESIFQLNISSSQNESFRIDQSAGSHVSKTARYTVLEGGTEMEQGNTQGVLWIPRSLKAKIYPEYDFANADGVRDVRANLFFDAWGSEYEQETGNAYNGGVTMNPRKTTFIKKYAMMTLDANHVWNHYAPYFAEADVPIYRFTGVKLLLAEAYVKDNQEDKAIAIIDEIRGRAGIGTFGGGDVLTEVLQQRLSELIGEGQVFYDAVRNNIWPATATGLAEPGRYQQEGYYFPVSNNVLTNNQMIKQTPFWDGKTRW